MNVDNKPLRGPKYRSRAFQEYLLRQTSERAAEIIRAERRYNQLRDDPGCVAQAAERDYQESMEGPESKVGEEAGYHVARFPGL